LLHIYLVNYVNLVLIMFIPEAANCKYFKDNWSWDWRRSSLPVIFREPRIKYQSQEVYRSITYIKRKLTFFRWTRYTAHLW